MEYDEADHTGRIDSSRGPLKHVKPLASELATHTMNSPIETTAPAAQAAPSTLASDNRPTAVVLGANGRLGLDAAGWQVIAPLRNPPNPLLPVNVRVLRTPVTDTAALAQAARGAWVVVHALNAHYTQWATDMMPLARAGLDLAEALGARFLLPGNVYNFGASMPAVLQVDTPQKPSSRKGALRVELESEIERRCAMGKLAATIIRAGDFFGGGQGTWFDLAITKGLAQGKLVYPGPSDVAHAWAYLPDLAQAFVAASQHAYLSAIYGKSTSPRFERLHFAGHTLTGAQLLDGIEQAATGLGIRPAKGWKRGGMPWGVIRAGGLVVPIWREIAEMAYLWSVPHALDGAALTASLGQLPKTPLDEALRATLRGLGFGNPAPADAQRAIVGV